MTNTESDRLANASTDANGEFHICGECDRRRKTKSLMFKHHMKEKEDEANDQTSDDSNIEIPDISTPSLRYKWSSYQDYLFERNLSLAYEK